MVFLELNRWLLTAALGVVLFVALVAIGTFGPADFPEFLPIRSAIELLFQALTTSLLTGVTIVITINQLVLSQELGAAADQRERMEGSVAFQTDAEAAMETPVSPAEPEAFMRDLVRSASGAGPTGSSAMR